MSEQITQLYRRSLFWWPAIMRAFLYAQMTMIGTFMVQSEKLTTATSATWGWVEWTRFWFPIASAGMGTVVAFLDQTMGKLREKDPS